jgi:hypothetical protein
VRGWLACDWTSRRRRCTSPNVLTTIGGDLSARSWFLNIECPDDYYESLDMAKVTREHRRSTASQHSNEGCAQREHEYLTDVKVTNILERVNVLIPRARWLLVQNRFQTTSHRCRGASPASNQGRSAIFRERPVFELLEQRSPLRQGAALDVYTASVPAVPWETDWGSRNRSEVH